MWPVIDIIDWVMGNLSPDQSGGFPAHANELKLLWHQLLLVVASQVSDYTEEQDQFGAGIDDGEQEGAVHNHLKRLGSLEFDTLR